MGREISGGNWGNSGRRRTRKKKKKKKRKERKKEKGGGGRTITNLLKTLPPSYKLGVERNGREGERTGKEL